MGLFDLLRQRGYRDPYYGRTPDFNPDAQGQSQPMPMGQKGPMPPPPEQKGPPAALMNPQATKPPQGALDAILGAFGKPGRQVQDFIKPGTDAARGVLGAFQGAAENGQLGGVAPRFQAGVSEAMNRQLQDSYRQAILEQRGEGSPFAKINPSAFTPESMAKYQRTGNIGDLVPVENQVQSRDVIRFREFEMLGDGSSEDKTPNPETGLSPAQDRFLMTQRAPDLMNVPGAGVIRPGATGSSVMVPESTIQSGAEGRSEAQGRGQARGAGQGGQDVKAPVLESYNIAADGMSAAIGETPQGGFLGLNKTYGSVFDKTDADNFDTAKQQLSTELRTIFRIAGEGTLSDREQEQYNLQLPDRSNNKQTNYRIMDALGRRIAARIETPITGEQKDSEIDIDAIAEKYK